MSKYLKTMYPISFTHWLHEVHSWGEGIRRVEVFDFNETHIYFVNGSGFKQSRLKKHVKRLEPLDWLPINGHDLYQQSVVVKQLLEAYQTASEVQELSDRIQKLIPSSGRCCSQAELELFRVVQNLYYDLYNNGLCNAEYKLKELKLSMAIFNQELIAEGMNLEQFDLVWDCWQEEEQLDEDEDEDEDSDPVGHYPEWDSSTDWFTERLELAFEALADASVAIAAKAQGWM